MIRAATNKYFLDGIFKLFNFVQPAVHNPKTLSFVRNDKVKQLILTFKLEPANV